MVWLGEDFYCRYERENSQRHPEEFRAERERSKMYLAGSLDLTRREARAESGKGGDRASILRNSGILRRVAMGREAHEMEVGEEVGRARMLANTDSEEMCNSCLRH